jgi:uncharacterized protein YjiS (DUF1127 family)
MTHKDWNETYALRQQAIAEAHRMRAEAIADAIFAVSRVLGRLLSFVFAPVATLVERARLRAELNQLDDRLLADIGLTRDDVSRVISGRYIEGRIPALVADPKVVEPANEFRPSRAA